jgi:hypothetical protein
VGITNEQTVSLALLALQECARLEFGLCGECRRILSEGRTDQALPIRKREDAEARKIIEAMGK